MTKRVGIALQTRFYRRWEDDALKRSLNLIKRDLVEIKSFLFDGYLT